MSFDPNAAAPVDSGIFGLPFSVDNAHVIGIPVAFDATTSYGKGAADGVAAIVEASRQVDLFDIETGRPYEAGIAMLPDSEVVRDANLEGRPLAERVIAAGGIVDGDPDLALALACVNSLSEAVNTYVYDECKRWLSKGRLVATLGGDHSTPFGAIQAHAEHFTDLGILHFDAHADLRPAYEGFEHSHASIMYNVLQKVSGISRIVQVGVRDLSEEEFETIRTSKGRVVTYFDADLKRSLANGEAWGALEGKIVASLPQSVYISFDIDALDPSLCPNTGTPVAGGLSFYEACSIVRAVALSGRKIVGLDLTEVAPGPAGNSWDANVGARILYKLIGWALISERTPPKS